MISAVAGRRSFVIVAVLVIVGSALLVVTGLLFVADAEIAGATSAIDRARSRAIARSGLAVIIAELDDQRDRILEGRAPVLDEELTIYETESHRGVVRLLPLGVDDEVLVPEAGKLDLNLVDAEALAATGLVDEATARAIVEHRDGSRPYQSVAELLRVPGVDAELLYGHLEDLRVSDQARGRIESVIERIDVRLSGGAPRGLADVVTVYSAEPALQRDGTRRINLDVAWSDELAARLDERFGDGASQLVQGALELGGFDSEAAIIEALLAFDVAPADWPDIVDTLTTEPGELHFGRLDINTASRAALLTLPGIEPEQAARMVRARGAIPVEDLATVAWPAIAGIVEPRSYETLAGRITTRSWSYRLRLAAGELAGDQEAMTAPLIYEAVIDLADPAPRIAYLREITMLQTAASIATAAPLSDDEGEPLDDPATDPGVDDAPPEQRESSDAPAIGGADAEPWDLPGDEDLVNEDPTEVDPTGRPQDVDKSPPSDSRRIGRWNAG